MKQQDDNREAGPDTATPPTASRRKFFAWLSAAAGALAALLAGVPVVGLLVSPARRQPERWRPVGSIDEFATGETVLVTYLDPEPLPWAGFAARSTAWVRRERTGEFTAFSPYCTHVGCPVTWTPGAEMFMCPCHGGTFDRNGGVASGPPPRPLERLPVRVRAGQVEIRTAGLPVAS